MSLYIQYSHVQYTGENVGGQPDVADDDAERPACVENVVCDVERHDEQRHGQVSDC